MWYIPLLTKHSLTTALVFKVIFLVGGQIPGIFLISHRQNCAMQTQTGTGAPSSSHTFGGGDGDGTGLFPSRSCRASFHLTQMTVDGNFLFCWGKYDFGPHS